MIRATIAMICAGLLLCACNSGEVGTTSGKPDAAPPSKDSFSGAMQNNPNLPPEAKKALLHQK